jgi:hypothetical protein
MASRAFVSPFTGQVSQLYVNVLYETNSNNTHGFLGTVVGNVTVTVYKAVPSAPFVASAVSVFTSYVFEPQGTFVDVALADTRHVLDITAGDRLVVLVTFVHHAFPAGQDVVTSFWISGGYEIS